MRENRKQTGEELTDWGEGEGKAGNGGENNQSA